jgi:hypothetical protein
MFQNKSTSDPNLASLLITKLIQKQQIHNKKSGLLKFLQTQTSTKLNKKRAML